MNRPAATALEPRELLLKRRIERIERVVAARSRSLSIVLEGIHDPHNLAAILRTAEGLGLQDVHVVEAASGFRPNAAVTQGADKWLTLHRHADARAATQALHDTGHAVYASLCSGDAVPLHEIPFERKIALVFGNEHDGVTSAMAEAADARFHIPMAGFTQSFNVSVAAAIALWAAVDARRRLGLTGDLAPEDRQRLTSDFCARAVKQAKRLGLR